MGGNNQRSFDLAPLREWLFGKDELSLEERLHVEDKCEGVSSCKVCWLETIVDMKITEADLLNLRKGFK